MSVTVTYYLPTITSDLLPPVLAFLTDGAGRSFTVCLLFIENCQSFPATGVGSQRVSSAEFTPVILYGGNRQFSHKKPLPSRAGVSTF